MTQTIGVDVYIVTGVADGETFTMQNWLGDDVIVVTIGHKLGKSVDVITATFDSKGMLNPSLSNRHAVPLNCSVPENMHVRNLVAGFEAKRVEKMGQVVAVGAEYVPFVRKVTRGNLGIEEGCVELNSTYKCGCRVSQCLAGSVIADALASVDFGEQFASTVDFAFTNAGGIKAGLPQGDITKGSLQAMLPYLNDIVRLDNVPGSVIKEVLAHSIADLSNYKTVQAGDEIDPSGQFLHVSSQLTYEWHFEGNDPKLGTVQVCAIETNSKAAPDLAGGDNNADDAYAMAANNASETRPFVGGSNPIVCNVLKDDDLYSIAINT